MVNRITILVILIVLIIGINGLIFYANNKADCNKCSMMFTNMYPVDININNMNQLPNIDSFEVKIKDLFESYKNGKCLVTKDSTGVFVYGDR